jgi:hypothetical protein
MIGLVALWWCYFTGSAIAIAITFIAWWWCVEIVLSRTKMTAILIRWNWDRLRNRGTILTQKTRLGGKEGDK